MDLIKHYVTAQYMETMTYHVHSYIWAKKTQFLFDKFNIHGSGHRSMTVEITNKMQPCIRIYYSTVHWRLNMFRKAYRMWWPAVGNYGRSPHAYVNQRLQIKLELLMMSGMPLETCWAFNERWISLSITLLYNIWKLWHITYILIYEPKKPNFYLIN